MTGRNELFQVEGRFRTDGTQRQYDVSADGQRFVMMEFPSMDGGGRRELVLIENWVDGLRERLGN